MTMNDVAASILVLADGMQRIKGELLGKDELSRPLPELQGQEDRRLALRFVNELTAAAQDQIQSIRDLLGESEAGGGGGQGTKRLLVICYRLLGR